MKSNTPKRLFGFTDGRQARRINLFKEQEGIIQRDIVAYKFAGKGLKRLVEKGSSYYQEIIRTADEFYGKKSRNKQTDLAHVLSESQRKYLLSLQLIVEKLRDNEVYLSDNIYSIIFSFSVL